MKKYSQKQIDDVKELYITTSLTNQQIGDKLQIPKGTVQMWIKRYGWERPQELQQVHKQNKFKNNPNTIKFDDDYYKAKQLYETTNLSVPDIANQTNLTIDQIHSRVYKYNWQKPNELLHQMYSNKGKERFNNLTKEELNTIRNKMSETNKQIWSNRSLEKKQEIIKNRKQTMSSKSIQEIQLIKSNISKGVQVSWSNKSEEEKQQIKAKQKRAQQSLSDEAKLLKYKRDRATKHKNNSFKNANAVDGTKFDSKYEVEVYEFCKRNNIPIECQIPLEYEYQGSQHITFIDFRIDGILFECKGGHLLHGIYDYAMPVPIERKLQLYKEHNIVLITDTYGSELIPKKESKGSNGLKYLNKCPNPLIGIDIELFKQPKFPYASDKPECFYKVKVDNKPSALEAWSDEELRWKMIKNRINYVGGFIDNKAILTAMNVTRTCKQPSWFDKNYAKQLISKYITTNTIIDPFAGWGTRCEACKELGLHYYGWDLNKELVDWHHTKNRLFENNCGIEYGDANNIKVDTADCSVFICPPYTDFEKYFDGQDLKTTQCEWLSIIMKNIPNAKEYLMVCKVVDNGWEKYIIEEKINKSHLGVNKEYVLRLTQADKLNIR